MEDDKAVPEFHGLRGEISSALRRLYQAVKQNPFFFPEEFRIFLIVIISQESVTAITDEKS